MSAVALAEALAALPSATDPRQPLAASLAAAQPLTVAAAGERQGLIDTCLAATAAEEAAVARLVDACRRLPSVPLAARPGAAPDLWASLDVSPSSVSPPDVGPPDDGAPNLPLPLLALAARLGVLYRRVFPDAPDWPAAESAAWADAGDAVPAVERFLTRVNTLFPVQTEIWDEDVEDLEWRLESIPVVPMGFDTWYDDWANLPEPLPYLLHWLDFLATGDGESFHAAYPAHSLPNDRPVEDLIALLRDEPPAEPALAVLPDLLAMLLQGTGNVWLDWGELALAESGGYPLWEAETIAWLTAAWAEASPVVDGVTILLQWPGTSPAAAAARVAAVHAALAAAWARPDHASETSRLRYD